MQRQHVIPSEVTQPREAGWDCGVSPNEEEPVHVLFTDCEIGVRLEDPLGVHQGHDETILGAQSRSGHAI